MDKNETLKTALDDFATGYLVNNGKMKVLLELKHLL
jgi:hypothetical protein